MKLLRQLQEGYLPNATVYTVIVAPDSSVTIDNLSAVDLQISNTAEIIQLDFNF